MPHLNTPISQKIVGCVSLSVGKWNIFLQFLEFISFGNIHKVRTFEGGEGWSRQKRTSIVFMTSFYRLKACKGEGLSENHQISAAYFMDGPFPKFYICMSLCSLLELKFGIYDISYTIFYTLFSLSLHSLELANVLKKNSIEDVLLHQSIHCFLQLY